MARGQTGGTTQACKAVFPPTVLCSPWKLHGVANSTLFSFSHSICHDTFATSCVLLMHCSGILPTSQPAVLQFRQVPHSEPRLLPAGQRHDRRHRGHPQPAGEQTSQTLFLAAQKIGKGCTANCSGATAWCTLPCLFEYKSLCFPGIFNGILCCAVLNSIPKKTR